MRLKILAISDTHLGEETSLLSFPHGRQYLWQTLREQFGAEPGMCPVAEAAYEEIISLPLFPRMTENDMEDVITALRKVIGALSVRGGVL